MYAMNAFDKTWLLVFVGGIVLSMALESSAIINFAMGCCVGMVMCKIFYFSDRPELNPWILITKQLPKVRMVVETDQGMAYQTGDGRWFEYLPNIKMGTRLDKSVTKWRKHQDGGELV